MKFDEVRAQVDSEARALRPQVAVLTVITAVLFAIGWLVGMVFRAVWLVVAWSWAAAVVGFKAATSPRDVGDGS